MRFQEVSQRLMAHFAGLQNAALPSSLHSTKPDGTTFRSISAVDKTIWFQILIPSNAPLGNQW